MRWLLLLAVLGVGIARPALADSTAEETRAVMQQIFGSMQVLLPLSVGEEFQDPSRSEGVRQALKTLASRASVLGSHDRSSTAGFRFLGSSLERDAREALRRFEIGAFDSSAFYVRQMAEYCVACHSRLPSPGDSPLAQKFISDTALAEQPPAERAKLQIATRRFDEALKTSELILRSPNTHPAEMLSLLTDYLIVSVRVKFEFDRPIAQLEKLREREDLWRYLRSDVEHWIGSLRELRNPERRKPGLASARAILDEARQRIQFPSDRRALVHYVVASGLLHRAIEDGPDAGVETAEAYYLLGMTEYRIGRRFWVSAADFFLETAIRLAPGESFADEAYALLEEETVLGYSGSEGTELPPDVAERLRQLRDLIDASRGGS